MSRAVVRSTFNIGREVSAIRGIAKKVAEMMTSKATRPTIRSHSTDRTASLMGVPSVEASQARAASPPKAVGRTWLKNCPIKV